MMTSLFLLLLIATSPCSSHQSIIDYLRNKWQEVVISSAVSSVGFMVETTVNKETGTWSMLLTKPRGPTCIVSYGTGWREVVPEPVEEGLGL